MPDEIIRIENDKLDERAIRYFRHACGFDTGKEKHEKMFVQAMGIREKIMDNIDVRAVVRSFEDMDLSGQVISLDDTTFMCKAFEQFEKENVEGIYAYVLTAGDTDIEDESVLNMYYAYAWGTAYVDAGRDVLEEILKEKCQNSKGEPVFLTDSFGPGYYGMGTDEMSKFLKLLDIDSIGVELVGGTIMKPLKSCVGMYIALDDKGRVPNLDCRLCISNSSGCEFCRMRKASKIKERGFNNNDNNFYAVK